MVRHGGSSASSYRADPTSPIPSHCASIAATSTLRVNTFPLCKCHQISPNAILWQSSFFFSSASISMGHDSWFLEITWPWLQLVCHPSWTKCVLSPQDCPKYIFTEAESMKTWRLTQIYNYFYYFYKSIHFFTLYFTPLWWHNHDLRLVLFSIEKKKSSTITELYPKHTHSGRLWD